MPQPHIPLQAGHTYHIWTHANGSENLFRNEDNFRYFLGRYRHHLHPEVETYAYYLMPNHLQVMAKVKSEEDILEFIRFKKGNLTISLQGLEALGGIGKIVSRQFSHLFNSYTQAYNKMYGRKGSLFIPNFNRKLIDSDEYFVRLIAYIHNNPVHHGFVQSPNEWAFSSWHAYLLDKNTQINKKEGFEWFGTKENFEAAHRELQP
ncbi:MAG: hypothetical protein ABJR05_02565 [Balneola sp.]